MSATYRTQPGKLKCEEGDTPVTFVFLMDALTDYFVGFSWLPQEEVTHAECVAVHMHGSGALARNHQSS